MMQVAEFKKYEFLQLSAKMSFSSKFVDTFSDEYKFREGGVEYQFICLEIKSQMPPYDSFLQLNYSDNDNVVHSLKIDLGNYRTELFFENGLYILYLNKIEEISKIILPLQCQFFNNRDENSSAVLVYKTKFKKYN